MKIRKEYKTPQDCEHCGENSTFIVYDGMWCPVCWDANEPMSREKLWAEDKRNNELALEWHERTVERIRKKLNE